MIDRLERVGELLERDLDILMLVSENEPIGIVRLSNKTGYPQHKIRYSLHILEGENLIEPTGQGAVATEHTTDFVAELDDRVAAIEDQINTMKFNGSV